LKAAMWKQLKNLLSFLTVLPFKMDMDFLVDSAKLMWLFPIVGALLGTLAGVFGWVVGLVLPAVVAGVLALAVLLLLTGLHHTDGLLDFGDAVMYTGTAERKIEIMHDQLTGAGAIGLGLMTYLVTAVSFGELGRRVVIGGVAVPMIVPSLVVVELCAKLSMVVATWAGRPVHEGMNSPFMDAMHGKNGSLRLAASLALSLAVAFPLLWLSGLVTVLVAVLAGLAMVAIAHKHFGGVTGDVLGATNEIVRMVCVVVLLAMLR
jgi:adenosylcobinamide-GDP ribazoletransferase